MALNTSPIPLPPKMQKLVDDACYFVRKNEKELIEKFAGSTFPSVDQPISVFMAGSPGAGKTEFSKSLVSLLQKGRGHIVRIDGDEIRNMLPGYDGSNAALFQKPISNGVTALHNDVLKKRKNFLLDGTFSNQEKCYENISRSIKRKRDILIVYVYQDPIVAWTFTQRREAKEGRRILKETFIQQYFLSRETTNAIKKEFGDKIDLWLIKKDLEDPTKFDYRLGMQAIDDFLPQTYSQDDLERILPV